MLKLHCLTKPYDIPYQEHAIIDNHGINIRVTVPLGLVLPSAAAVVPVILCAHPV